MKKKENEITIEKYVGRQYWIEDNSAIPVVENRSTVFVKDQADVESEQVNRIIINQKNVTINGPSAEMQMRNHSGDDWSGKYRWQSEMGTDEGFLKARLYRSKNGILFKGKWEGGAGAYTWIVEGVKVEHFPDEKKK